MIDLHYEAEAPDVYVSAFINTVNSNQLFVFVEIVNYTLLGVAVWAEVTENVAASVHKSYSEQGFRLSSSLDLFDFSVVTEVEPPVVPTAYIFPAEDW